MKLMNFRSLDPEYTAQGKTGLTRGNKDEALVWNEFSGDMQRLAEVAQFIRDGIAEHTNGIDLAGPDELGIEEAEEGRVATRMHRFRERDRRLVSAAKKQAREQHGRLFCVACGFDFSKQYGDLGDGVIDVHHTKPVHTMRPGEKTNVSDLILLCSNCHRIVHSKRKWLTLEQLKAALGR
ncbi:HNH endonuclease [Burkholderia aenigmatica]|uniref:HNH endonuclease n=1 Tax=Burkholderia aenigmatica TaxID=2015348 RepID=UPI003B436A6E